jgi:hypothetical protein
MDEARRRLLELMDAGPIQARPPGSDVPSPDAGQPIAPAGKVTVPEFVTMPLSVEMREQMGFLAAHGDLTIDALALDLLATELEARVCLIRGPFLRKYIYR